MLNIASDCDISALLKGQSHEAFYPTSTEGLEHVAFSQMRTMVLSIPGQKARRFVTVEGRKFSGPFLLKAFDTTTAIQLPATKGHHVLAF